MSSLFKPQRTLYVITCEDCGKEWRFVRLPGEPVPPSSPPPSHREKCPGGGRTYGCMLSELHEKRRELVEAHARIYELERGIDELEREMKARA